MRRSYHEELEEIAGSLVAMTRLVADAVSLAAESLLEADLPAAETVISGDAAVDALFVQTEQRAAEIFARQQPVARDLRFLIASLRIVTELERMGDLATHLSKVARRRYPQHAMPASVEPTMREMGYVAQAIVRKCGAVLETNDVALAAELERDDDAMDALHRKIFAVLFDPAFQEDIECVVDVTLCGRYLERLCDHAVSVARQVTYVVTGQHPHTKTPPA